MIATLALAAALTAAPIAADDCQVTGRSHHCVYATAAPLTVAPVMSVEAKRSIQPAAKDLEGWMPSLYRGIYWDRKWADIRRCIMKRESNYRYKAANKTSSARGAYQFLDNNWRDGLVWMMIAESKKDRRRTDRGGKEIAEETNQQVVKVLARQGVLYRFESWQGVASLAASSTRNRMLLMNHLPECFWPDVPERAVCICERLRACEQRVNSSNLTMWDRTQEQAQQMVTSGLGIAWKDGFKEGINAAREAVRTIASDDLCCMCPTDEGLTLAAIDALREKP